MDIDELPNTLPMTQTQASQYTQESQPIAPLCYGRLIGKIVRIAPIDLSDSEFKVGRDDQRCQLILNKKHFSRYASILNQISKIHFAIQKNVSDIASPTFIVDVSLNGTFVNGRFIGKNKRMILKHLDVISIGRPNVKAFVFHDLVRSIAPEVTAKEVLKKYHIGKRLGSGAFGTVYLIHHTISCQPFAMKHVVKDTVRVRNRSMFLNDPHRILIEIDIMKNLNHPCVIRMHDIVDKPDSVYMVLEYMEGGDLLERILKTNYLQEKTAKLYFFQMCHAVKYLHEQGIAHRDLKPENFLLRDGNEHTLLKVTDFGLSKFVCKDSFMHTLCGTPIYMAPEMLKTPSRVAYTNMVDNWGLGVVLFTMLSGTVPFSDDYSTSAVSQIKRGKFTMRHPVWKTVSLPAKKLIFDILNVNYAARPSIDTMLASSWLRGDAILLQAKQLMNVTPRTDTIEVPQRRTASDVEDNGSTTSKQNLFPPSKRKKL